MCTLRPRKKAQKRLSSKIYLAQTLKTNRFLMLKKIIPNLLQKRLWKIAGAKGKLLKIKRLLTILPRSEKIFWKLNKLKLQLKHQKKQKEISRKIHLVQIWQLTVRLHRYNRGVCNHQMPQNLLKVGT